MLLTLVYITELSWSVISTRGRKLSDNPFRFLSRGLLRNDYTQIDKNGLNLNSNKN